MHASLSWLRVEERLTASLLLFIRNINVLCWKSQIVCIVNLHTALTHTLIPPDMPPGVFSQYPNPDQIQESVQYYIEPLLHGTSFHFILLKYLISTDSCLGSGLDEQKGFFAHLLGPSWLWVKMYAVVFHHENGVCHLETIYRYDIMGISLTFIDDTLI